MLLAIRWVDKSHIYAQFITTYDFQKVTGVYTVQKRFYTYLYQY